MKSRRRGRIRPLLRHFVGFCTTDESNRIDTLAHAVTAPCTNMDSKNIRDGVCKRLLSFGRCALNRSREKNPLDSDDFLIGASTLEYNAILYSSLLCARKSSYQKMEVFLKLGWTLAEEQVRLIFLFFFFFFFSGSQGS